MLRYITLTREQLNQPNSVGKLYDRDDLIQVDGEGQSAENNQLTKSGVKPSDTSIFDYSEGYIIYKDKQDSFHVFIYS